MKHELNIWVLGGDLRQAKLAQLLAEDGHTVHTYALDACPEAIPGTYPQETLARLERADCLILPLPVCSRTGQLNAPLSRRAHPLEEVLDAVAPRQFLCGGRVEPEALALAAARGLTIWDYFRREELAVANAVPTAEGALQLAMERLPITIHGARVLVVGFGRVGQITAQRFAALGGRVTVAARRLEALAWAGAMGLEGMLLGEAEGWQGGYDLVVNTVPAPVVTRRELEELPPHCLILDLASKPGGGGVRVGG